MHKKPIIAISLMLIIVLVSLIFIHWWESEQFRVEPVEQPPTVITTDHRQPIEYQGVTYVPRSHVKAYLIMGIDKDGPAESSGASAGGGQADVLLVLAVDEAAQTQQLLMLNRDTITRVPVLGMMGTVIGYEQQQLALAHFYGDGRHKSCQNTVDAVSHMLANQPFEGYASLNMGGIAVLNDAVGGVTVTIADDFSGTDNTLIRGETITLQGQQAVHFVRARRSMKEDPTNLARMRRQQQYLQSLTEILSGQDQAHLLRIYDAVKSYVVTDLGSAQWLDLAEQLQAYRKLPTSQIAGHNEIVDGVSAFYVDADNLTETIIGLFYSPV